MMYIANKDRYYNMKYNRCGNSGLFLPAVSLGLWHNFGGTAPYERSREMVLGAFDMGITHFDLANNYGPPIGSAEETFGKILKSELGSYRDEIIISTKAGFRMWDGPYGEWGSKKYLIASLDQSLKRMGLDYVDIFYSHRPDPDTPLEETCDALAQAVKSGKALYVGVSNYSPEQTARAYDLLKERGVTLLIHQPSYSMLNRWVEDGLLDTIEEKGMGAIAYSPLAQGLLTNRYFNGIPADSRAGGESIFLNDGNITPELLDKTYKLNEIAQNRSQTLAQMALAWVLKSSAMTSVIIGASRLSQIKENAAFIEKLDFTQDELDAIDKLLNK
ncbi:MAG: L-glyceraldehyde 3-phosphate reductase [Clostridiales bacterium]|nr:L-glyceraldehyde 3-phosphate reductase [Clostridiales bacterium]